MARRTNSKTFVSSLKRTMEGGSVEVLWELPTGRKVWWDATIQALQLKHNEKMNGATARLRYRSAHGYASTVSSVLFINEHSLEHVENDGTRMSCSYRIRREQKKELFAHNIRRSKKCICNEDVDTVRRKVLSNVERIQDLEKRLDCTPSRLFPNSVEPNQVLTDTVLTFLSQRTVSALHKKPMIRLRSASPSSARENLIQRVEGITRSCIRITADCDLGSFELIAKKIRDQGNSHGYDAIFIPSYEFTQMPSQGTRDFAIYFHSFSDVCDVLGISSTADRLQMLRRYGFSKGEGTMRLLGAYTFQEKNGRHPTTFYVGRSLSRSFCRENKENDGMEKTSVILSRETSGWNSEDRRYDSPLCIKTELLSPVMDRSILEDEDSSLKFFRVIWKRAHGVSARTWSKSLSHPPIVTGKIELSLPCIVLQGSLLCDEFTQLLTEKVVTKAIR